MKANGKEVGCWKRGTDKTNVLDDIESARASQRLNGDEY
jgi:hypothetical protein